MLTGIVLSAGTILTVVTHREQDRQYQALIGSVTGGDSYPIVVPHTSRMPIPLMIINEGDNANSGVSVEIDHVSRKVT